MSVSRENMIMLLRFRSSCYFHKYRPSLSFAKTWERTSQVSCLHRCSSFNNRLSKEHKPVLYSHLFVVVFCGCNQQKYLVADGSDY